MKIALNCSICIFLSDELYSYNGSISLSLRPSITATWGKSKSQQKNVKLSQKHMGHALLYNTKKQYMTPITVNCRTIKGRRGKKVNGIRNPDICHSWLNPNAFQEVSWSVHTVQVLLGRQRALSCHVGAVGSLHGGRRRQGGGLCLLQTPGLQLQSAAQDLPAA